MLWKQIKINVQKMWRCPKYLDLFPSAEISLFFFFWCEMVCVCFIFTGKNALHLAARNGQSLCVQKLLQVMCLYYQRSYLIL